MSKFFLIGVVLFSGCSFTATENKNEAPMPKEVVKCKCSYCYCTSKIPESEEFNKCNCTEKRCKDNKCNCNKWKKD